MQLLEAYPLSRVDEQPQSFYGPRPPRPFHDGIDIGANGDDWVACWDGFWHRKGFATNSYGWWGILENDQGNGALYAHGREWPLASRRVDAGDKLGEVGSSGNSTGPHCHLGLRERWNDASSHRDPWPFLKEVVLPLTQQDKDWIEQRLTNQIVGLRAALQDDVEKAARAVVQALALGYDASGYPDLAGIPMALRTEGAVLRAIKEAIK